MKSFYDIETGEHVKNIIQLNDGTIKSIDYRDRNYIIKDTDDGLVELIVFDNIFRVPEYTDLDSDFLDTREDLMAFEDYSRQRKGYLDKGSGVFIRTSKDYSIADFRQNQRKAGKRAIKKFFDYCLTNTWEYFVTLTARDSETRNSAQVMSAMWQAFVKRLQRYYPDLKAAGSYEEFDKGGYHLHALLSDVDLNLVPARNNKVWLDDKQTKKNPHYRDFLFSEFGQQLFNCTDWKIGFNNVVCLKPDSNNVQVVNYMCKYMNKCSPAPWSCKRFFKTQNLTARDSVCGYSKDYKDIVDIIEQFNLHLSKDDGNGHKYYRNYGSEVKK